MWLLFWQDPSGCSAGARMRCEGNASMGNIGKEAMTVIQAGDESGLGQDGCSADCETWSDSALCWRQSCQNFMMGNAGPLSSVPNKTKWNTIMSINYQIEVDITGLSRANFPVKQNFLALLALQIQEVTLDLVCFQQLTWGFQVPIFQLSSIRSFRRVVFTLPLFLLIESVTNRAVCTILSHLRAFLTVDLSFFVWEI